MTIYEFVFSLKSEADSQLADLHIILLLHRINEAGLQMSTKRVWTRSLKALGGASTVEHSSTALLKSQPVTYSDCTSTAPAALFTDIDVVQTTRRI